MATRLAVSRTALALVVALLALAVSGRSLIRCQQLGRLGGLVDEHHYLGANLNVHGTLGLGDQPVVNRPPGYPFFAAVAMRLLSGKPASVSASALERGAHAVYLAQCLLHAATAAILFLWLAGRLQTLAALTAALLFALNPYSIALVGLLHYDVLHNFFLVSGVAVLSFALGPPRLARLAAAGAFFGLAALVRPVTLTLPALVLPVLWLRRQGARQSLVGAAAFGLASLLVVLPWSLRNYAVSGRFVLVQVQGFTTFWGSTVADKRLDPNHYQWHDVAATALRPIWTGLTGESEWNLDTHRRFTFELEDALRTQALRNLRERPFVYLRNVGRALLSLGFQINSVLLEVFEYVQRPGPPVTQAFFGSGNPQDFASRRLSGSFEAFFGLATLLAYLGAASAARARDPEILPPLAVLLCVVAAHALVLMDLMYYYLKLPFVFLFAGFFLNALAARRLPLPGGRTLSLSAVVSAVLLGWCAWLTGTMLASCAG